MIEEDTEMIEEKEWSISRRKMLSLGVAGGALAMLGSASSASASAPTFTATPHYVCVTDYGAVSGVETLAQAQANTVAFRRACASVLSDYQQLQSPVEIYVPAGDWFLSDGFTVPLGCTLRGAGVGATVLIIPASYNSNPAPLITLGCTLDANNNIVDTQHYSGVGVGEGQLLQPACVVKDIFLYSANGTGIDVQTAGWLIQNIWLITLTGIVARYDGIISNIYVDSSSTTGLYFINGQNILVDNFYAANCTVGIEFAGANDSIRFSNTQICFPKTSGVVFSLGSVSKNVSFTGLSMVGNHPYTFVGGIQIQGTETHLIIDSGSFVNLPGYAIYGGDSGNMDHIVLNNCTFDGSRPHVSDDFVDNTANAGGIIVGSIHMLELNSCRFLNMNHPALITGENAGVGNTPSFIIWNVGLIQGCSAIQTPVQVNYQNVGIYVSLSNVTSLDGQPLFQYVSNRDAGAVTGRFINCYAPGASRDVIWNSQNASTQLVTRVAVS